MKVYSCQDNDLCHNFELIEELRERNAQLLAALRPFAALIPQVASLDDCLKFPVTVGDIRRAAAALAALDGKEEAQCL